MPKGTIPNRSERTTGRGRQLQQPSPFDALLRLVSPLMGTAVPSRPPAPSYLKPATRYVSPTERSAFGRGGFQAAAERGAAFNIAGRAAREAVETTPGLYRAYQTQAPQWLRPLLQNTGVAPRFNPEMAARTGLGVPGQGGQAFRPNYNPETFAPAGARTGMSWLGRLGAGVPALLAGLWGNYAMGEMFGPDWQTREGPKA